MDKVRILCVGIGGYANNYLSSLLACPEPDFEFVGMVDIAAKNCKFYPELVARGVPLYDSMEDFYASNTADLAIITTPTFLHTRQILCALKNGSHVMCEKPLSGVSADEQLLLDAMEKSGKFVIIGYNWSYGKPIQDLKQDISDGVFGKAVFLKSLVLWPRSKEYYARGSGWGGRISAPDGTVLNDSVVSNATAHYLHNMLFVTGGAHGRSSEVASLDCTLLRANNIENFDTATVRFTLADGTPGMFVASHAVEKTVNPTFEYRFQHATVTYSDSDCQIVAHFKDGSQKVYGDPKTQTSEKIYEAISAVRNPNYVPPCSVSTAAPQVRCVEKIQQHPIATVHPEHIREDIRNDNHFLFVPGLDDLLLRCYQEELLLSECPEYEGLIKK